ncbi:T9SS type A sorting domain-containing protein, partial [Flavobacteriales bacterium]|nr:T9SS type A sorting domain-containing protein [Flavobacteriales bacterium]
AAPWSFVRLKYRVDSGGSWANIGGMGVMSPLLCKTKNGLTPSQTYRVIWRTFCNPTGGPYRSPVWDGPITWTQPSAIRVEGGTAINNLDVYPNPSRDIFNVSFTSEDVQNLEVRIINVIGEVVYTEDLNEFVGEYTKQVDLTTYTKGVYLLEIDTDNGIINKKLILQ